MYDLFRRLSGSNAGGIRFGELAYLRRSYTKQIQDIKSYYRRYPKRVDSDNLLGRILTTLPMRWDMEDRRYVHYIEDQGAALIRSHRFTSALNKGRVHTTGVTLGQHAEEIVLACDEDFDVSNAAREWREWSPYRLLYHTRYDMGMPILNNTLPGKGWGVGVLNVPMLALQYRYWVRQQLEQGDDQKDSVFRFIGGYVLPNMVDSYLDVAFFNRLDRLRQGLPTKRFSTPHPFYLTDYSHRVDNLCQKIIDTRETRNANFERMAQNTPCILKDSLRGLMQLPDDPITRQNEWAMQIVRLPYVNYLLREYLATDRGDRREVNDIYTSLRDADNDRIFSSIGSPEVVGYYRQRIRHLIAELETHGEGGH